MLPLTLAPTTTALSAAAGALALTVVAAGGMAVAQATPVAAAASTAPACAGKALAITTADESAGLGHVGLVVRFENVSRHSCSLTGYPGVDALGKHGQTLVHAKRQLAGYLGGATSIRPVSIRPGHFASALLEWEDMNHHATSCRTSASIAVTAANTRRTVHRRVHVAVCQLEIHPTVSGKHGTGDVQ